MRGLGAAFLVRRARSSWLLLACVAVTVLVATGLAAAEWTFAAGAIQPGAQSFLAAPQNRVIRLSGVVNTGEAAADTRLIRATLRKAWPGVGFQMQSALWAEPIQLSTSASGTFSTQIQPASLEGISARVTLTAGTWPGPPRRGGPVPVALPAAAASRLHVTVGSVLTGAPASGGALTSLQVTGLFRPRNPVSPYWMVDLLPSSGVSHQNYSISTAGQSEPATTVSYGPAVVNPAAFGGALAVSQGSWTVLPQAPAMARGNLGALAVNTSVALSQLGLATPEGLQVTSNLPRILDGIASTSVLSQSLFTIAALELLLVAGAGLVLAARLLASLREEESALLQARGATRWQLGRPVLAEAVVVAAAASVVGVLAGTRLTGVLASLGGVRLAGDPGGGITPLAWLSALVMLVLCASVMAWPALHTLDPGAARLRRARQARLAGVALAGGDLAVLALAAVAVWQLRGYSAVVAPGVRIARDRSRGRRRPRSRACRAGAHPAARAAAAGQAGRQADRPRTVARRRDGELADRQAADPPGGPGAARRPRDGDHHTGAGRLLELAAVGRGPGSLRGRLGCAGRLCGRGAAGRSRGHHRRTGCHRRDPGQRRRHRQREPADRAEREHGGQDDPAPRRPVAASAE